MNNCQIQGRGSLDPVGAKSTATVAAAYSWPSTASSAYEYLGHYFRAMGDTDPSKPLDRLELVLDQNEQKIQIEIRAITLKE